MTRCNKHPDYTGKGQPTSSCKTCWEIFEKIQGGLTMEQWFKLFSGTDFKTYKKKYASGDYDSMNPDDIKTIWNAAIKHGKRK
jgi:hypothetical protein